MEEKIIERIKKLQALHDGALKVDSIEEATNAAEKIQALLLKHNLTMAKVEGTHISSVDQVDVRGTDVGYNPKTGNWMSSLLMGLCETNFCSLVITQYRGAGEMDFHVMGEPENIEVVIFLFKQLTAKIIYLEKVGWYNYIGYEKRGKYRRGFLMGAAVGVVIKLRRAMEMAQESSDVQALVLVKSKAVEEFKDRKFPNLKRARAGRSSSRDGADQGFQAGKGMNIHKGIGSKHPIAQLS